MTMNADNGEIARLEQEIDALLSRRARLQRAAGYFRPFPLPMRVI
jgi:hypothetical protein